MFCKNCGAQINDGAGFCPKCGATVPGAQNMGGGYPNQNAGYQNQNMNQQPQGGPQYFGDNFGAGFGDNLSKNTKDFIGKFKGSAYGADGQLDVKKEFPRRLALLITFLVVLIGIFLPSAGIDQKVEKGDKTKKGSVYYSMASLPFYDMDDISKDAEKSFDKKYSDKASIGAYLGWVLMNGAVIAGIFFAARAGMRVNAVQLKNNRGFYRDIALALACLAEKYVWFLGRIFIGYDIWGETYEDVKGVDFGTAFYFWIFLLILIAGLVLSMIWFKDVDKKMELAEKSR